MKLISSSLWSHVVPILRPTALSLPCHSWTRIGLSVEKRKKKLDLQRASRNEAVSEEE